MSAILNSLRNLAGSSKASPGKYTNIKNLAIFCLLSHDMINVSLAIYENNL